MALACRMLVLVLAVAHGALAHAEAPSGLMTADEEMVQKLLRPRSTAELNQELDAARQRAAAAKSEVTDSAQIASVALARVRVKKDEIGLLKERMRLAKKEGEQARRAELETLRERQELELEVFEAMHAAASAQKDRAEAALNFAEGRVRLQEVEMRFAEKREARLAAPPGTAPAPGSAAHLEKDRELRAAARAAIDALKDYARRSGRLADTTSDLAKARMRLLNAWEAFKSL
jgi:hypothetical protein